ncbi:MAG: alpha/beta hydrolase family protein [Deltaproteobacteria bacterium]|nr:alpha/beta hydrolase family protein [Deltaproteobacteria bacterium]
MTSILDRLYASHSNRLLFFKDGWGDLPRLREIRRIGSHLGPPQPIEVCWERSAEDGTALFRTGAFLSPYTDLPLPAESRTAYFELVVPRKASRKTPICIHFAATGDEGFARRRRALALPLLRDGIGSLILENPYYGRRRPPGQHKKMLNRFSDLWAMGGAVVEEGRSLMQWLRREGYERLGVCGISMGGSMAARVAALEAVPVAMVGCVTAHSASAVFTEGILKNYLAWEVLNRELDDDAPAIGLMRELLDLTDLRGYSPPRRPEAAFLVAASRDAYIPPASAALLHAHWPGSTMRWLATGHVGAFLFHRLDFLEATRDAFARL